MDNDIKPALLIIDMINDFDFEQGEILSRKAAEITTPIVNLKQQFQEKNLPVVYINDHFDLWKADIDKIIEYCTNDLSREVIARISPGKDDYFLIKPKHSAFYETALHTLLQQLGVNTLILAGVAGNICVLFTANDAYMREYKLYIPEDCVASNSHEDNEYALAMMREVLSANTDPSAKIFDR
ncbi:isochorismatase [Mesobacillus campisalis]|uniref:Isochorismatase n=1 Tax=Mesobacillus campisalis TaxID=1408103 RepID=A0A0M2SU70_9BACI|nr:isochorismatase family cysteine hydrolase [Mesobacillus campisalis]KKK36160.1 isochorismatase [Mesobacillus campisalis]